MKNKSNFENYSIFSELLCEYKIYMDSKISFKDICKMIGADTEELDNLIVAEVGMGGEELIQAYRRTDWENMIEKYELDEYNISKASQV